MKPARVLGLGLWTRGFDSIESFQRGEVDPSVEKPPCHVIPSRLRRATTLTTKMGAEVISQAVTAAGTNLSETKLVFGSAYGEFQTAVEQLDMMEVGDGRLSPARFKNSVHNTVTGLLSIALGNHGLGTALAAGTQTFAMCLLEALALVDTEGGHVALAVSDEWPGEPFASGQAYAPMALGLCLGPPGSGGTSLARISEFRRRESIAPPSFSEDELSHGNPATAALPLFRAILGGQSGTIPLELHADDPWCIDLEVNGES